MVNIRIKGASAEREIAEKLNVVIRRILKEFTDDETILNNHNYYVQRNQNQTAVGGNDLVNTYGFGIEIKRQEVLNINTWWVQCTKAAQLNSEIPVLLYRQTRKPWKCVIQGFIGLPKGQFGACRAEVEFETFLIAFEHHVRHKLNG
jgi:hypothetical protein